MKTIKILSVLAILGLVSACGQAQNPNTAQNGLTQNGMFTGNLSGSFNAASGQIPFIGQGVAMDSVRIYAGRLPQGQFGQVQIGGGGQAGGIQYQPKQGRDGTIQLMAQFGQGQGNISGVVLIPQLGMFLQQQMLMMGGLNQGMWGMQNPQNMQQNMQVVGMGLHIIHSVMNNWALGGQFQQPGMGMGQVNQALIYLQLSNGATVGPFQI